VVIDALQSAIDRMYPGCTVDWKKVWGVAWVLITRVVWFEMSPI
jgi:hypothetical protein